MGKVLSQRVAATSLSLTEDKKEAPLKTMVHVSQRYQVSVTCWLLKGCQHGRFKIRERRYLRHCGLQHYALDWQGSRIQHGNHHHQHVRSSWRTLLSKVEKDAEAIFIIGCHRKGTACKKVLDE